MLRPTRGKTATLLREAALQPLWVPVRQEAEGQEGEAEAGCGVKEGWMDPDEGYPHDEEPWRYLFEDAALEYFLGYSHDGKRAHVIDGQLDRTQCGLESGIGYYGLGTFQERVEAHRRPLCKLCAAKLDPNLLGIRMVDQW